MKSKIKNDYRYHDSLKIFQGDILRDVNIIVEYNDVEDNEFKMPYIVILSQDCDLNQDFNSYSKYTKYNDELDLININFDTFDKKKVDDFRKVYDKLLPSILVCPAFPAEKLRNGNHLQNYNNFIMQHISSKDWKKVENNEVARYHYLKPFPDFQIPKLVVDFKRYYTLPTHYVYSIFEESYVGSLNELYLERLSQRFVNYLSRIGLP